MEVVDSRT